MTVTYRPGDAIAGAVDAAADGPALLVHGCNDLGAWGAGFTRALDRRWPHAGAAYRDWFRSGSWHGTRFELGAVAGVPVGPGLWVVHAITQHGIRSAANPAPVDYDAISAAFATIADRARDRAAAVHMPRVGCGLAGGRWAHVEPLLAAFDQVTVTVWDL